MAPTLLNLFFVQELLKPENPRGWELFLSRVDSAKRRALNPAKAKAATKSWEYRNPKRRTEGRRKWDKENYEQKVLTTRAWAKRNRARVCASKRAYESERLAKDPGYRLINTVRKRILRALKKNTKGVRTQELLGMKIPEYMIYLQGQFRPGMTWENQGSIWHIDHVRPCASFDFSDPTTRETLLRECFNWSNTQPLFVEENLRKGDHYVSH